MPPKTRGGSCPPARDSPATAPLLMAPAPTVRERGGAGDRLGPPGQEREREREQEQQSAQPQRRRHGRGHQATAAGHHGRDANPPPPQGMTGEAAEHHGRCANTPPQGMTGERPRSITGEALMPRHTGMTGEKWFHRRGA